MSLKSDIERIEDIDEEIGIIIGNFDGHHLGHKSLVGNFIYQCQKRNIKPVAITFFPHPHLYFHKNKQDYLLTEYDEKIFFLKESGIFHIFTIEFTKKLQQMKANDFIENIIFSSSNIKYIHLGHDFRLGHGKIDATKILIELAKQYEVEVGQENAYKVHGQLISSTKIRELIKTDISTANQYLGHRYCLSGKIMKGKGIGSKELLPTANLSFNKERIIPSNGVYITETYMDDKLFESVTNIGVNPTVGSQNSMSVETYILNFAEDIYNRDIEVHFIKKIREELKFNSFAELKSQIFEDVDNSKNYFREKSPYKLALIGKDISHSKSQVIYEKILQKSVDYTLLDYQDESEIPDALTLLNIYQGVSITAPYKEYFAKFMSNSLTSQPIVNTLYHEGGEICATNTDALAIVEILKKYKSLGINKVFILGDGSMAKITTEILKDLNLPFSTYSRKNEMLDKISYYINQFADKSELKDLLIINTCSRVYCFDGPVDELYHFWDMNYTLLHHINYFLHSKVLYQDGLALLELQAKYALNFWNLNKKL